MSYGLMVYAVDVALLQSIAGNRNKGILDEIKQIGWLQKEIKRANNYFDDEIEQGTPRREQAIEAIIMGTVPAEGHDEWTQGAIREVQSWYAETAQLSEQYSTAERKIELGLVGTYH